jgi:hypothetical protein
MVDPIADPGPVSERQIAPVTTAVAVGFNDRPYVDWSAVFGGAVVALGLWMLLTSFGASIGIYVAAPWSSGDGTATNMTLAAAAWFAIVQIFAVATGGYLSGRLRQRVDQAPSGEIMFRDGANGLLVWGLGLLAGTVVVSLTALAGFTAVANAPAGATRVSTTDTDVVIDRLFRPQVGGDTADAEASETTAIAIVPRRGRGGGVNRDEVARILTTGETDAPVADGDKAYLAALVAARTNLDSSAAEARVDETLSAWTAERKKEAEDASKAGALAGLWTVAILLISGLAAWWAGALGGSHRDDLH